jgi:hypothetical protein
MTPTGSDAIPPRPSSFVTAVAWIFIALSGFSTLIALLQNLMINLAFPVAEMQAAIQQHRKGPPMPWLFKFMAGNVRLIFFSFLAVSALTFAASIGLLKRRNWARITFIGILALGIVWNLGGMAVQYSLFSSLPGIPDNAPEEFQDRFDFFAKAIMVFSLFFAVGISGLFGWIIKRLVSSDIRREFV